MLELEDDSVRCPFPAYEHLRNEHPVVWSDRLNAWLVSRYDDIRNVLRDAELWSNRLASGRSSVTGLAERVAADLDFPPETRRQAHRRLELSKFPVLLLSDPPLHKRQRSLVAMAFTPGGSSLWSRNSSRSSMS
ncbi:cytochrome P450 [Rhodococcus sp. CX]|uniref:cytochrome P450 n=1 Tax=Rhodococcus sp. CX TaxID=2789880 RepID=UPI001E346346|nr:cytochrome P450 [Rhodococcus sp. CX]